MAKHVSTREAGSSRKRKIVLLVLVITAILLSLIVLLRSLVPIQAPAAGSDNDPAGLPPADNVIPEPQPPAGAEIAAARETLLSEAERLLSGHFYDEAIALLSENTALKNDETEALAAECIAAKNALVKYEGKPYHVFFHSLIVYPELAFDNKGHPAEGYNMWMTTQSEFIKMLPLLQENNFILYDIEDFIIRNPDGTISPADIYLPEGKKPLVISIDDVCYYDYMKPDGFANRLVLKDGKVLTEVIAPDGTVNITDNGDVMPILDGYVAAHPEFSWRGAKGIVAVTGYQGALGYRITDLEGKALEAARKQVSDIAQALRADGWKFANHSYTHNGSYFQNEAAPLSNIESDTERWKRLIEPYVGETKIFISPFGVHFPEDSPKYRHFVENGFDIYCGVGSKFFNAFYEDSMSQDRFNLDGYMMFKHPDRINETFFDVSQVIDPARPPLK